MKRIFQILFFAIFMTSALSFAQQPKDNEGFEPVNGDMMQQGETIPAARLVGAAYGFIFAALLVWVASVTMRARRVEDEMDTLKRKLEAKG